MPTSKQKFIVTVDKLTADKMIASGLKLVAHQGAAYTFLNQPPTNFTFEQFDKTKFCYTNTLSI